MQLCVYRIIEGNYGSVLVNVIASIIDEGSIFAYIGLLDESCSDNEVFLPDDDDEERCTFKKECEATDAFVRIGVMLLDVVQILRDCHEMRHRHIYGRSTALVRPIAKPNAVRKLTY